MATINGQLEISLEGIGHALSDNYLVVPQYQRSYAWGEENVRELLLDLNDAIINRATEYFLGSVVISQKEGGKKEVVDGQQRLATTSIILATIRDYFFNNGDLARSNAIQHDFLVKQDLRDQEWIPRLTLNAYDHDFFLKAILSQPNDESRNTKAERGSHKRLQTAAKVVRQFLGEVVNTTKDPVRLLIDWIEYLLTSAKIIWVNVPDDSNAFVIFETLNDRGLALSIADLLKNYLFGKAEDKIEHAQAQWNLMLGAITAVGDEDLVLIYLRQLWSSYYGLTRERVLFSSIKQKINSKQQALNFVKDLADNAKLYAGLLSTEHEFWNSFPDETRSHIETFITLNLQQPRPLLLAILSNFEKPEAIKAIRYLVSCSIRFTVVGKLGGSDLEHMYANTARDVRQGEIKTAQSLAAKLASTVPSDTEFQHTFATATVSSSVHARYYLRTLENKYLNELQPELVPNENPGEVNLEHVLPKNPSKQWGNIEPEQASALYKRLGNLALLKQRINSEIGNAGFDAKKAYYVQSKLKLTQEIAAYDIWGLEEINERQNKLADLAVKAWSVKVK